jgi:hypothetical protein
MTYTADTEIDLKVNIDLEEHKFKYIISSQHRKTGNPNKCIWKITFDQEVDCFIMTVSEKWKDGIHGWGLKALDNVLQVVGVNNIKEELKLAKFIDGTNTNVWHGYPADYVSKSNDRPTTEILKKWVDLGYITKAKMSKIRLGQSCNL